MINVPSHNQQHIQNHYPHMFPRDIDIWNKFLETFGNNYNSFDYDVKVGSGSEPHQNAPEIYVRMIGILSKYRIDAVGYDGTYIYIMEVKPNAAMSAIGQVMGYVKLFERDFSPTLPLKGVIVTNRERPDMRELTSELGFDYYIV